MLELLGQEMPGLYVSAKDVRPYLRSGFPWHTPDQPHTEIQTPDAWWDALMPVFESGLRGINLSARQAQSLARQVRYTYVDPSRWRLFDRALDTLYRHGA